MRGGLVAAGGILMILGVAWFIPVAFGGAFGGIGGAIGAFCLWILLAPVLFLLGLILFIVGLASPSQEPVAATQTVYVPYYAPPPPNDSEAPREDPNRPNRPP